MQSFLIDFPILISVLPKVNFPLIGAYEPASQILALWLHQQPLLNAVVNVILLLLVGLSVLRKDAGFVVDVLRHFGCVASVDREQLRRFCITTTLFVPVSKRGAQITLRSFRHARLLILICLGIWVDD